MSGYVGRGINYGNAVADHFTGNGGATYTLTYDTTTNGVVISLDGVVQKNGTDFNIAGTALTFTSVVANPIAIQVIYTGLTQAIGTPSDNTVSTTKLQDNSVTGSKIAMGSDAQGDTLYYNGTDYVRLPKGTASQVLKMNSGATAPEWAVDVDTTNTDASNLTSGTLPDARFPATLPTASGVNLTSLNASNLGSGTVPSARLGSGTASSSTFLRGDSTYAEAGGGAWTLISTAVASDSASLTITGLDSTYDSYSLVFSDIRCATDAAYLYFRVGDSSGIDSGGTDYDYHNGAPETSAWSYSGNFSSGNSYIQLALQIGSGTGGGFSGTYTLSRGVSAWPMLQGTGGWVTETEASGRGGATYGFRTSVITLTQVQILMSSGNIASGRMSVYGIKHT